MKRTLVGTALAVVMFASTAGAQAAAEPARAEQARARFAQLVQRRLNLTDAQLRQLAEVNRRYETPRRDLLARERETRRGLRAELSAGDSAADRARVDKYLTQLLQLQHERLDLVEREQKDLAGFLTPMQRARYLVFQDEVRRRVEEARRQRSGQGGAAGRALRPGGPRRGLP